MTDVLLDSNVVLRLLAIDDVRHAIAADAVASAIRDGHRVLLAPQVVAETWVVLTRPVEVNGFGWPTEVAHEALESAMTRIPVLRDIPAAFDEWWKLVRVGVRGKRAHDARLAAHMLAHGVRLIMTFNVDDFASIEGVVAFAPGQPIPSVR